MIENSSKTPVTNIMEEHRGTIAEAVELLVVGAAVGGSCPTPGALLLLIGAAVPVDDDGAIDGGGKQHSAWATAAASRHFSAEICLFHDARWRS